MRAMGEVSEAPMRGNPMAIHAKETFGSLAQETVVLQLGISASNCIFVGADSFRCHAAGEVDFAVVQSVVSQLAPQFDP
jgi:hypothetical protein